MSQVPPQQEMPAITCPTEEVQLGSYGVVRVRSLTRAETMAGQKVAQAGDMVAMDAYLLMCGCDLEEAIAKSWLECTPSGPATRVISAITRLTDLDGSAGKE